MRPRQFVLLILTLTESLVELLDHFEVWVPCQGNQGSTKESCPKYSFLRISPLGQLWTGAPWSRQIGCISHTNANRIPGMLDWESSVAAFSGNFMADERQPPWMQMGNQGLGLGALITFQSRTKLLHRSLNHFNLEECRDDEFTPNTPNSYLLIKNNPCRVYREKPGS